MTDNAPKHQPAAPRQDLPAKPPQTGAAEAIRRSMQQTVKLSQETARTIREQNRKGVLGFRVKVF